MKKLLYIICVLALTLSINAQKKQRVEVYGTMYENVSKKQQVDSIRKHLKQKPDSTLQKNDTTKVKKPTKLL